MIGAWLSRQNLLKIGDLVFLVTVGALTTLTMHAMHQFGWNFVITGIAGMVAAMVVQMLLAFGVAPVLGSIESMTPSMAVGMVSPMSVCTLHLMGHEPAHELTLVLGALFGAGMFAFVQYYGSKSRRTLERESSGHRA